MTDKIGTTVDSTLAKGLRVLEELAASAHPRGVTELSRELALTKSNAHRLLRSLSHLGYVKSNANRTYEATLKVWQIGLKVIENLNINAIAEPEMQRLSDMTGEAIYLAVPDDLSVIYIDKVESTRPIRSFTPKGGSAPIHCVGTGKALLSANYGQLRNRIKERLVGYTDQTITEISKLDKDMAATAKRGYALDKGEYRENIYSFGATIYLPTGEAIAAIGVSAPNINLNKERIVTICQAVQSAATRVTQLLQTSNG
ncbi:MAG: IclR family transcriptional regulator [Acidiferrobacterales bacterium]|nr:IclR family transcriptional regulator [Acidiferrobacterales bacterium]